METVGGEKEKKENEDGGVTCAGKKLRLSIFPKEVAADFCAETSLHGLKYIGQKKRHLTER